MDPAAWVGSLWISLPRRSKSATVVHPAALPYAAVATFMVDLRGQLGTAARALEFAILTAARTGEVIGARWAELALVADIRSSERASLGFARTS